MSKAEEPTKKPKIRPFHEVPTSERCDDAYLEDRFDEVIRVETEETTFTFYSASGLAMQIKILDDALFRVWYNFDADFTDTYSYAVDPNYIPELPVALAITTTVYGWQIETEALHIRIKKKNGKLTIYNLDGDLIAAYALPFYRRSTILKGTTTLRLSLDAPAKEAYYGLGDKTGPLDMRGRKYENWCTDSFAFHDQMDPLYRSIPFYLGQKTTGTYGFFLDNTWRSTFDFDSTENHRVTIRTKGGDFRYYFFYDPEPLGVIRSYTLLTGTPSMPPLWALGFHQCRWSYYPEQRVREVASTFREMKIPCDAIYLDIDYMDGYRCFTWNNDHFPDPTKMIGDLKADGFQTVVMIDPGLKVDPNYRVYREGSAAGMFCLRSDGSEFRGPVWPQQCAFPDYTNPKVRKWWGELYDDLYVKNGVAGFWNDMNEPAVFKINKKTFPEDIRHDLDGKGGDHRAAHNIYGLQMTRASYEGLKKLKPDTRPFLLARATFSGGQRFAAMWTGDNVASWEHLRLSNLQGQRMAASGFSFIGCDIGGFVDQPEGELLTRWLQMGVFQPFYRIHSMGNNVDGAGEVDKETILEEERNNRADQEPWANGEPFTTLNRAAIEWRYQLLPVIYTAFWQYYQQGQPMIQSMALAFPYDRKGATFGSQFLFGDHLLICPVEAAEQTQLSVHIPEDTWFDYWTGERFIGPKAIDYPVKLEQLPVFVREGAVIPHFPVQQFVNELVIEKERLHVFHTDELTMSHQYEDQGEGYDYQVDGYNLRTFQTYSEHAHFFLRQVQIGRFESTLKTLELIFIGLPFAPTFCKVDGVDVDIKGLENGYWSVEVTANFELIELGE